MLFLSIVHDYFRWHYTRAFMELFHVWLNFLWFIVHFFSLPQLVRSWVAPWRRITEQRGRKWSLEDLASYLIIGFISRLIGFVLRTVVILLGLVALLLFTLAGFLMYVFWLVAPFAILGLFGLGIMLLIL